MLRGDRRTWFCVPRAAEVALSNTRDQHSAVATHVHRFGLIQARSPKLTCPHHGAIGIIFSRERIGAACVRPDENAGRVTHDHQTTVGRFRPQGNIAMRVPAAPSPDD